MLHRTSPYVVAAVVAILASADTAAAQTYAAPDKPRRHFISVSYDWIYTQPLSFAEHPLSDLVGREVASVPREAYDYRTRDGEILIDVREYTRRGHGAGVTLFPLGSSVGATLALRGSIEQLPDIDVGFTGPGAPPDYRLTGARAYDVSAGIHVADRSAGWGLGSHAFVGGGLGWVRSDQGDGDRYFAEGGGGLTSGPFGVELTLKVAWNRMDQPVAHTFITLPIAVRGTITF
jgi:hypothetical protein